MGGAYMMTESADSILVVGHMNLRCWVDGVEQIVGRHWPSSHTTQVLLTSPGRERYVVTISTA